MATHIRSIEEPRLQDRVSGATMRLRRRLADAAERIIAALDALDTPQEDLEDGHDREEDRADFEPSLGATADLDQGVAWGDDRASGWVIDGEESGTEDDVEAPGHDVEAWKARRAAKLNAKAQLRAIIARRDPLNSGSAR